MRKLWLKVKQSTACRVLCRAYARWVEADGNEGAAAFAYYLLLSFLPLVILLVAAGSLFVQRDVATQAIVEWVQDYMPLTSEQEHSALTTIHGVLAARGQISLVAVPLLLWSALQFLSRNHAVGHQKKPSICFMRMPVDFLLHCSWGMEKGFSARVVSTKVVRSPERRT